MAERVVVALGGNVLIRQGDRGIIAESFSQGAWRPRSRRASNSYVAAVGAY